MNLERIGFYTMSDSRAQNSSASSPLKRCELILTGRCNFKCPYCRHIGGDDLNRKSAFDTLSLWIKDGLENVRFSGGEPTLYSHLPDLVSYCRFGGVKRIAISTNGSADFDLYENLIRCGANDISVSLDACCSKDGDRMAGGIPGSWRMVVENIRKLSELVYVTVGIVVTEENAASASETIQLAHDCGVADIRIIPAAQDDGAIKAINVIPEILADHPILSYRVRNLLKGRKFRGLGSGDSRRCGLVVDDMAVLNGEHYPCIIYMRESGFPIGKVGLNMRKERIEWSLNHDTHSDPICSKNCLDVCVDYNNKYEAFRNETALSA